jgi:hypothetical protein
MRTRDRLSGRHGGVKVPRQSLGPHLQREVVQPDRPAVVGGEVILIRPVYLL